VTPGTGPGSDFLPLLRANLTKLVATNSLQAFYPPQRIEEVLARLVQVDFRCVCVPTSGTDCAWLARCACAAPLTEDSLLRNHPCRIHACKRT